MDKICYTTFSSLKHPDFNKTKDWALVQNAALVIDIEMLKLG